MLQCSRLWWGGQKQGGNIYRHNQEGIRGTKYTILREQLISLYRVMSSQKTISSTMISQINQFLEKNGFMT